MLQSSGPQSLAYTHLIVIRHGETAWNRERRLQGQIDIPLNDTGRAQARALAEALTGEPIDAVYTSDLGRARETATPLAQALMEITRKGMAMTAVVDPDGRAIGVFTDGDLRRLLETPRDWKTVPIGDVMHHNPRTVNQDQLAVEAVQIMETNRINQLLVVDGDGRLVGALHIHDLTRAKVI
ncbi:UNVERIFIED_CONTAM: histidine phosphatase family protein [Microbacterium sp. SLM126]